MTEVADGWLAPSILRASGAARFKTSLGPGDLIIPVVFPDYRVRLPFQTGVRDAQRIAIGHAGILLINGETGVAAYYEWGRYDTGRDLGSVRRRHVTPTSLSSVCRIRVADLRRTLSVLCRVAGELSRAEAVLIPCDNGGYDRGTFYAEGVRSAFAPGHTPAQAWCASPGLCVQSPFVRDHERIYAITDNNCLSFAIEVAHRASRLLLRHQGRNRGPDLPSGWANGLRWSYGFTRVDYQPGDADITIDP